MRGRRWKVDVRLRLSVVEINVYFLGFTPPFAGQIAASLQFNLNDLASLFTSKLHDECTHSTHYPSPLFTSLPSVASAKDTQSHQTFNPAMAAPANNRPLLFFSGQCTAAALEWVSAWLHLNPTGRICYSFPSFNQPRPSERPRWDHLWKSEPDRHVFIDVPNFDPFYRRLCARVVETARQIAPPHLVDMLPRMGIDEMLQEFVGFTKKNNLGPLLDLLSYMSREPHRPRDSATRMARAAQMILRLVQMFECHCKCISGDNYTTLPDEWTRLSMCYMTNPEKLLEPDSLHVNNVLKLFGLTPEECEEVVHKECVREKVHETKSGGLKMRFLSKLIASYGVEGCTADIVNLLVLLTHPLQSTTSVGSPSRLEAVMLAPDGPASGSAARGFVAPMHENIPTEFFGDGESDDCTVRVLIELLRREHVCSTLQIPTAVFERHNFECLRAQWDALLIDSASANASAFTGGIRSFE